MTSTITVAGQPVTLVALPGENLTRQQRGLWFSSVEWNIEDAVSVSKSVFTGQTQSFEWPGAEDWYGTCELPAMTAAQASKWRGFLGQCRGVLNPFLLGDPLYDGTKGRIDGHSVPLCDTAASTTANKAMSKFLQVRGLAPNVHGLMLAGEWIQVGYRLHYLLDDLSSDGNGKATAELWPSLREQPPDGTPVITNKPRGLFRLASNKRTWSYDYKRLSHMSIPVMEYR